MSDSMAAENTLMTCVRCGARAVKARCIQETAYRGDTAVVDQQRKITAALHRGGDLLIRGHVELQRHDSRWIHRHQALQARWVACRRVDLARATFKQGENENPRPRPRFEPVTSATLPWISMRGKLARRPQRCRRCYRRVSSVPTISCTFAKPFAARYSAIPRLILRQTSGS